jgi:hypothetical protein
LNDRFGSIALHYIPNLQDVSDSTEVCAPVVQKSRRVRREVRESRRTE